MRARILAFERDVGCYRFDPAGAFAGELREVGELTVAAPEGAPAVELLRAHDVSATHHATPFAAIETAA